MARTIVPFGPQHPVLPEPLQLQLVLEDEKIVQGLPVIGYIHRGLERLIDKKDFNQMIYVVERICGICSFQHAMGYCQGIEELMKIEVTPRAKYLRVIWAELHRIHSHLLWLGLLADAYGFESLFMQTWRNREVVMDLLEATAGNRVIVSTCIVGGLRRDIEPDMLKNVYSKMETMKSDLLSLREAFIDDYAVKQRTVGVGILTKEDAYKLGACGPTLRGSGWAIDHRATGYAAYADLDFEPIVENDGDSWARTAVRYRETLQAIDLVQQAISKIPEGEISVKVKGFPEGETISRVEQPRGEVLYYIKANGTKFLDRLRVRTPTFSNIPPLLAMLPGSTMADVPILALTIDPCISCTER